MSPHATIEIMLWTGLGLFILDAIVGGQVPEPETDLEPVIRALLVVIKNVG